MSSATLFLSGGPDHRDRTIEHYLAADDGWLEDWHDWVQWAFPNQEPSPFNPEAPVWDPDEARALPPEARENLLRMVDRFERFLRDMRSWRRHFDHNHQRITRVILCLRDAGLDARAETFHAFVTTAPEPSERSRMFWRSALDGTL